MDSKLAGKANSSHKHAAADITSVNASAITGIIPAANLPSSVVSTGSAAPTSSTAGKIYIQTT